MAQVKKWKVTAGFDCGDGESGPLIHTDRIIVEATTAEEAKARSGFHSERGFCGCYAEEATAEDITAYQLREEAEAAYIDYKADGGQA